MVLRLGIPKGSLQDATFKLFAKAGWSFRVDPRSYQPVVDDEELEPALLRPQEIPGYVQDGVVDAGLTGLDWITDCGADLHEICELRYSKLTTNPVGVVLAVQEDSGFKSTADLGGKRIATEYVRLTQRFLKEKGVEADVEFSWGACEVKVAQGVADAIVVNTETGSSLRAHDLRIIETLLTSTTRFVCSHEAWADGEKRQKLENMAVLLQGAMNAAKLVGLKMNLPAGSKDEVLAMLPALQNPTVSQLADERFIAVEVVLSEKEVRDLIPKLKRAGATGLVEYPLNKVIF
ncbi:MAG: ATP phosphoribosyltransferase [Armatimonadetes bacterium]|nr:ATP phosphoribosyltransferase [Armatimonadota bacterium]